MQKFFLVSLFLASIAAAADSSHTLRLNPHLILDNIAVRALTKTDAAKIQTALRMIEAFKPAADVISETEPNIFITKSDSAWTDENLGESVGDGETMKLLDRDDPYRIVLFWDRVTSDPYPVMRMSLSFLEIYNQINPLNMPLPSNVIGDHLQRMYRRIEFLGNTQVSELYRRLDLNSKYALNKYLEIFQAQLQAQVESRKAIRKMFLGGCGEWLN